MYLSIIEASRASADANEWGVRCRLPPRLPGLGVGVCVWTWSLMCYYILTEATAISIIIIITINCHVVCNFHLAPVPRVFARDRAVARVELCSYYFIEVDIEIVFFIFFSLIGLSRVACLLVIPLLSFSSLCVLFFFILILLNCVHINNVCTNWCERLLAVCNFMFAVCGRRRISVAFLRTPNAKW